uniref:Uncharacterized protein n=1 Tax=Meleagris gallopavo TaxID=9103 RepID=A0A803YF74_MELGA
MEAQELFRRLGAGARFDVRRFGRDARRFGVRSYRRGGWAGSGVTGPGGAGETRSHVPLCHPHVVAHAALGPRAPGPMCLPGHAGTPRPRGSLNGTGFVGTGRGCGGPGQDGGGQEPGIFSL